MNLNMNKIYFKNGISTLKIEPLGLFGEYFSIPLLFFTRFEMGNNPRPKFHLIVFSLIR